MQELSERDPLALGRYRLIGRLGAGGMGRVYLGRGPSGELVAVKVMHSRIADDPGFRRRFATEVAIARKVSTPGVARVVDADPDASLPWLAMEYVPAPTLEAVVGQSGPIDGPSLGVLAWRLAEACADLHASDIAHRDLKPSNVLLADDRPKLIDFGIARAVDTTSVTQTGLVLGPPGFMSPEQALGDDPGLASDVFSLAAVLVHASTGRGPFGEASSALAMVRRVVDDEPDLSGVPDGLRAVLEPCFAKDPDARPTAGELARRLVDHGTGPWPPPSVSRLVAARPPAAPAPVTPAPVAPAPVAPARRVLTRRRVLIGLGSAASLIGLAVGLGELLPSGSDGTGWDYRWHVDTGEDIDTLLVGDVLYAATRTRLYALDPGTGDVRWQIEVPHPSRGVGLALAARGAGLVTAVHGLVVALDPGTGDRRWEHPFEAAGLPVPRVAAADDDTVYAATDTQVMALDGATGGISWAQPVPAGPAVALRPTATGCLLAAGSQLHAFDAASGQPRWQLALEAPAAELVVEGGTAVVSAGPGLVAVDAHSGALSWRTDVDGPRPAPVRGRTGLVVGAGTVAVLAADGRVHGFALRTGAPLWAYPTLRSEEELRSMATDGARILASTARRIYSIDPVTGSPQVTDRWWEPDIVGADHGVVYLGSHGRLNAVQVPST